MTHTSFIHKWLIIVDFMQNEARRHRYNQYKMALTSHSLGLYTITSLSLIELLWIVRVQGAKIWFLHLVTWWPTYAPVTLVRSQRRSSKNSLGHKDRQLSGVWSQFVTNHTMYVQSFYADWRLKMVSTCFSPDFAKICDDLLHHSTFLYYGRGKNTLR
jgi:hypothetical protein